MKISFDEKWMLPQDRNPSNSATTNISWELANNCDGELCGLTGYDGDVRPPVQPVHLHLVVSGREPLAGPRRFSLSADRLLGIFPR